VLLNQKEISWQANYRVFLNPQPQQLSMFIHGLCQTLHIDLESIPYGRPFEQREGAYLDPFSRIASGLGTGSPGTVNRPGPGL